MRIEDLREFLALARSLNFSRTAKELYITQPVLSRHISNLEQELGTKLFIRDQHRVQLTRTGEVFLIEAEKVVKAYGQAIEAVMRADAGDGQALSIGFLSGAITPKMKAAIVQMDKGHPEIQLFFYPFEAHELFGKLVDGTCDIIIGTSMFFSVDDDLTYGWQPLYIDRLSIALSKDHPLATRDSLSVQDLAGMTIIDISPYDSTGLKERSVNRLDFRSHGIEILRRSGGIESLRLMLQSGKRFAIAASHMANFLEDEIAVVPLAETLDQEFHVGILWRRETESALYHDLIDALVKAVQ